MAVTMPADAGVSCSSASGHQGCGTRRPGPVRSGACRSARTDRGPCPVGVGRHAASGRPARRPAPRWILRASPNDLSTGGCSITLVVAPSAELGGDRRLLGRVEVQPGHLVLVLVSHQLVQTAGEGGRHRQCGVPRPLALDPGRLEHLFKIAPGVGVALVAGQIGGPPLQDIDQGGRGRAPGSGAARPAAPAPVGRPGPARP